MTDAEIRDLLTARLAALEERIAAACARAGRVRDEITVIAVTKTVPARVVEILLNLGQLDLGESRPQVLWDKATALPRSIRWHQIGHLQRNKADRTVELITRIHSADSVRLLETLASESSKRRIEPLPVLLEVNVSREDAKHGFSPEEIRELPRGLLTNKSLRIDGLMCMAAYSDDPADARPTFRELRSLRDQLQDVWTTALPHLSMGMSGDFEVAIEEGATFIRPGSVLFEGLESEA